MDKDFEFLDSGSHGMIEQNAKLLRITLSKGVRAHNTPNDQKYTLIIYVGVKIAKKIKLKLRDRVLIGQKKERPRRFFLKKTDSPKGYIVSAYCGVRSSLMIRVKCPFHVTKKDVEEFKRKSVKYYCLDGGVYFEIKSSKRKK